MNNKKIISAEVEDVLKRAIIAGLIAGGGVILSYLQKKFSGTEKEPQIAPYKNPYNPNDSGSKPWWTQPPTVTPTVISDATTSDSSHCCYDADVSTGQIPNTI